MIKEVSEYIVKLHDNKEYCFYPGPFEDIRSRTKTYSKYFVKTIKVINNEDWKTALAHNQPSIPAETELQVKDILTNFYGRFFEVYHNNMLYYVSPQDVEYVRCEQQSFPI